MIEIETIRKMDDKKHIAILDTSSISFLQGLTIKGQLKVCKHSSNLKITDMNMNYLCYLTYNFVKVAKK